MKTTIQVSLYQMIDALGTSLDMIDPTMNKHHKWVTYLAMRIARECGLDDLSLRRLFCASIMHDIGAVTPTSKLEELFDDMGDHTPHCVMGAKILTTVDFFKDFADIVRFHHEPWNDGKNEKNGEQIIPLEAYILHLADRISLQIVADQPILAQVSKIDAYVHSELVLKNCTVC